MWNFGATDVYALFNSHVEKSTTGSCKTEGGGGGGQGPFTQCVKNIWFGRGWLPLSIADFFHLVMAQLEERKGFPDDILFVFTSHLRPPAVHRTCSLLEAIVKTCSLLEADLLPRRSHTAADRCKTALPCVLKINEVADHSVHTYQLAPYCFWSQTLALNLQTTFHHHDPRKMVLLSTHMSFCQSHLWVLGKL